MAAFAKLKENPTSDLVLILQDSQRAFVVQCDACGNISAILMQVGRVVAYESKILQDAERNLQVYEKE